MNDQSQGIGVQVFTHEGYSGFAATDNPTVKNVREAVGKAVQLAELNKYFGGEKNTALSSVDPLVMQLPIPQTASGQALSLPDLEQAVKEENHYALQCVPGLSVQTFYRQISEQWQIIRSDGTTASFTIPRATLVHSFTARRGGRSVTLRSAVGGKDEGIILDLLKREEARRRGKRTARLAVDLLSAPPVKGGHYKLLIDYALAKGLAHEAFGHAVESDEIQTSILGRDGKLAIGTEVASPAVSITDGPLIGDWAYQPISANGITRDSVKIVDKGKLAAGLGDLFSAAQAGVVQSGACRAQSYAYIPLPRMSNIRIEVEKPLPLTKPWYEFTPVELYRLLLDNGLISAGEDVYYLSGYKGGQVNTQYGDFVFNCAAIYKLGEEPVLYQPGIFAGSTLSALNSIRAGIGPLVTDAIGTCGKFGQGVPSSGGSHAFLLLEASREITIGGE